MNIPQFFIRNKQFTICIFLLIAYWGIQSFKQMPKSEDPIFPLPQYSITCIYPGATPSDIEQLVVNPLELQLGTLEDIEYIKTQINDGSASVKVKFLQKVDVDKKFDEVQREVNKVKPGLPVGIKSINVEQGSTSTVNILQYAVVSENKPYAEMQLMAENMQIAMQKVKGIRDVVIDAYPQQQITVDIDLPKMAVNNITLLDINNAIKSESINLPGGYIDVAANRYNIRLGGDYKNAEQIRNTIIKATNGKIVFLKNIATVTSGYEQNNYFARYNGKRAIFVSATQQDDSNIFTTTERVEQELEPFYHHESIKVEKIFDQSLSVSHRLNNLYRDFVIAILLVLITLLPLGLRASYVVMFTIPTSIFIGIGLLYVTGYSLNQFSIVGLVIALGLLVDDSIIVVENIVAKLRKGETSEAAAVNGTNQLIRAIITVTICILLSFMPLVTLQGSTGDFIRSMPLAVIYTMAGSLFVSVTLTPLLSKWFLQEKIGDNVFYRSIMKFNEGPFMRMLIFCMKWPRATLAVAISMVIAGFLLISVIGVSFFPSSEKPQFLIDVAMPVESNINQTNKACLWIEGKLKKKDFIASYATNVGKGNPRVYYNVSQSGQKANTAEILCFTKGEYNKDRMPAFLDSLRAEFGQYPSADIQVHEFMQGPGVGTPIEIRIFGDDIIRLKSVASNVENILKNTPGTIDVDNPLGQEKAEIKISINHEKALALGVSIAEVTKTIRTTFAGISASEFTDDLGNNFEIVLTLSNEAKNNFDVFKQIYVSSAAGKLIPLLQVANFELQNAPSSLQHYDKRRSVTITGYIKTGFLTSKVTNLALDKIKKISFPPGFSYQAGGEAEKRDESFGGLSAALTIAVFGIVAVLILAFNGLRGTLIVASAIPLGVLGAIVALFLGGYSFSFTAFVGIITLIGLEVKNTIIIVDFTNQMRAAGHDKDEAIRLATEERFTPIFLTTMTAVFALVPLVLERSDFFSPLALVMIGGLLSSLLLTRFVEPVLYKLIMK